MKTELALLVTEIKRSTTRGENSAGRAKILGWEIRAANVTRGEITLGPNIYFRKSFSSMLYFFPLSSAALYFAWITYWAHIWTHINSSHKWWWLSH